VKVHSILKYTFNLSIISSAFFIQLFSHVNADSTFKLKTGAYKQTVMSDGSVTKGMKEATKLITQRQYSDDYECSVELKPNGSLKYDNKIPEALYSANDMKRVRALPYHVVFVRNVLFCGKPVPEGTTWGGCGSVGRKGIALTRGSTSRLGKKIAHEFGHNAGFNGHSPDHRHIMSPTASTGMNKSHCKVFASGISGQVLAVTEPSAENSKSSPDSPQPSQKEKSPFEQLFESEWSDGIPLDQVNRLTPDDIEKTRSLILEGKTQYYSKAIFVLALRGTSADKELLFQILQKPLAKMETDEEYDIREAKLSLPNALGMLTAKTNDNQLVQRLASYVFMGLNHPTELQHLLGSYDGVTDDATSFAENSGVGLALAGNLGKQYLNTLPQTFSSSPNKNFSGRNMGSYFGLLNAINKGTVEKGLKGYLEGR